METEDETEEQESTKRECKHPAKYYVSYGTGNEAEDQGDNKVDEWGPGGKGTEDNIDMLSRKLF